MREFSKLLEQLWATADDWRPLNLEFVGWQNKPLARS